MIGRGILPNSTHISYVSKKIYERIHVKVQLITKGGGVYIEMHESKCIDKNGTRQNEQGEGGGKGVHAKRSHSRETAENPRLAVRLNN